MTLEVTPAQANSILLAQASGATLDFVVLPAAPGGDVREPGMVPGADGTVTTGDTGFHNVSVTKAQLAPYAESKKVAPKAPQAKTVSTGGGGGNVPRIRETFVPPQNFGNPGIDKVVSPAPLGDLTTAPSPTYDIPIYADGKTVRVETVRRPQD